MRQFSIITTLLLASLFILTSCGDDKDITELAWTNESSGAINQILWAGGDNGKGIWSKTGGYIQNEKTEAKEIDTLAGEVECTILDGEEFVEATVTIAETNSSSLALAEGESYTYTITAEPVAKKKNN